MDYGHPLRFGVFLTPSAAQPDAVVHRARLADQVGLDLVTFQDHPYQPNFLDTWTLLATVAAGTRSVHLAPNVANLPLRPPAVLARAAASLDLLSDGRVELGLGAGAFWDAIAAMGGERLTPGQSVQGLAEAITVLRELWDVDAPRAVRVEGEVHRVVGAKRGPRPAHPIGIWVGAYGRRMLELTGRLADGWLPSLGYLDPADLAEKNRVIDDAARVAGREPADVRRLLNVGGDVSAEQLSEYALEHGFATFVVAADEPDDIRRFAAEIAPAVREIVSTERDGGGSPAPAPPPPDGLGVVPTPDDGARRSSARPWDEGARPTAPAPDPQRRYTAHERATGQHLVDIHDGLRAELDRVLDLVSQVADGQLGAGTARSAINEMTMRQNNWTLGTYCESYCRVVTMHHSIEDAAVFPHLRGSDERLAPVLDRLSAEHVTIHGLLDAVDRDLVALVSGEGDVAGLQAGVDLLADALLSHLSYEEKQLIEPLARFGLTAF